jgi:hypothetical protein
MLIGDVLVRRVGRDLVFERDGLAISMRSTVADRVTLRYIRDGVQVGEATGVRDDPVLIVPVIRGVLGLD